MSSGVTSQDIRTGAREIKLLIDLDRAERVREWARARLLPDPHGAGTCGDEYETTSLYFDTDALDVFHRRGSFARSKYRIRRYGVSDLVFLERKMRTKQLLSKRRTIVPIDALARERTARPDVEWFWRRIDARRLHVKCQVWYRRTARVGRSPYGIVRLTIDTAVTTRPASSLEFLPHVGVPALTGAAIVELKFTHEMPALFKELVETFALAPQTLSKYRLALAAIGEREECAVIHA